MKIKGTLKMIAADACKMVADGEKEAMRLSLDRCKVATLRCYISSWSKEHNISFSTRQVDNTLILQLAREYEIEIEDMTLDEVDKLAGRGNGVKVAPSNKEELTDKGRDFEEYKRIKDKHVADWSEEEQSFVMWIQSNYQPHELHY